MNEKQIEFITSITKAINEAQASRNRIVTAIEIGIVPNPELCFEYIENLDAFISAGLKMGWQVQLLFGENQKIIAESLNKRISEC